MKKYLLLLTLTGALHAQVTNERLLKAESEPNNWLTYSGSYKSWRYSTLDQINRQNAANLKVAWVHQMPTSHRVEATPIVVDGVMYVSEPPSNVFALDAATGRPYWHYKRILPAKINVCCDAVNRGVAVLGDRVFVGTVDAHLVALDAKTGAVVWDVEVADSKTGYSVTGAPLIVSFSNRCCPTKAVAIWRSLGPEGHAELLTLYLERAGFSDVRTHVLTDGSRCDPMTAVVGRA